ncbi:MAG: hypothetical protein LCI00_25265 [Chloroflexi bacterium]|nr:hypothetical protein [Chloroflexota bacterium]MCC6896804.1 hypothetical protein [Anaerolineae bacterium]
MANLTEVQMALKQGEKAKAAGLLKTVLQTNPSADAWVMAARLSSNPDTQKQHLHRALAFNPKHIKARDMLRDLGETPMSASAALSKGLLPALRAELEKFGANKPLLKNFSPQQRMITALSLYAGIILLMVVMVSTLVSTPSTPVLPEITPVTVFESDSLISQWSAAGLNISNLALVQQEPNVLSKDEFTFMVTDESGPHLVTAFLYNDVAAVVNDGVRLTALTQDGTRLLGFIETAVIVYPADLNEVTVNLLLNAFNPTSSSSV